ncbi:MAG: hypothetical protein HY355_04360 [Armatimonadetes bacterium]|nr:hypothetical protein [Armatimonadota bacterium]
MRLPAPVVLALALAIATGPPAVGAPSPVSRSVTVTADEITVDAVTQTALASGRVRLSDGVTTATAARATLFQREGRGVLTGDARVVGPQGILEGAEITVFYTASAITRIVARGQANLDVEAGLVSAPTIEITPATDTVTAAEGVTFFTQPDVVATGRRLTFQRARGTAVLEGGARLQNRDGFIEGQKIEGVQRWSRATVTGPVHATFRGIDVRSRTAEFDGVAKKIVFVGDVRMTQPGRVMDTEKVTVWYADGRIVAEGQTRVRLETPP